jgi:hypothetical protein
MRSLGARLVVSDRVLSRYYFTDSNKSGNAGRRHMEEGLRIVRRHCGRGWLVAPVYGFLYNSFDLYGCYDVPQTCTQARKAAFTFTIKVLEGALGRSCLSLYNLQFASLQERNLKWW